MLLLAAAALACPWVLQALGMSYYITLASKVLVFGIAATSLNLVLGYGGLVSFGHAAFVGLGAYTTGVLITEGLPNGALHLASTLLVTGLAALVIGAISLRTRGVYFIMITLAFAQMLFYLANSIKGYGGDEGLNIKTRSLIGFGLDLKDPTTFYHLALAALALSLLALHRFVPSRLGRAIVAMRDDDVRAEALGLPVFALRLVVFVVAGMVGGLAGFLTVNHQGYVSPNLLHWTQSGTLMVMVILGGVGTLWGGVLGAAGYGAVCTAWAGGCAASGLEAAAWARTMSTQRPLLDVQDLSKRFGGVQATHHVHLQVQRGEVHALIGPNGAGKTSLVAQLAGQLAPDSGRIFFDGIDITRRSAHARARMGLTRSFQITRLFKTFTVLEHLALALQAAQGSSLGAWTPVKRETDRFERAHNLLPELGLQALAHAPIDALSHGQRRALEVGMAVAALPRLVLLDEPMAGMGPEESQRMETLIKHLSKTTTLLLIEHDVDAVFRLADRVSVLVSGQIVATGAPDEVRRNEQVIAAYLGQD